MKNTQGFKHQPQLICCYNCRQFREGYDGWISCGFGREIMHPTDMCDVFEFSKEGE